MVSSSTPQRKYMEQIQNVSHWNSFILDSSSLWKSKWLTHLKWINTAVFSPHSPSPPAHTPHKSRTGSDSTWWDNVLWTPKNNFSLVCWVHLIEIKSVLSTYGKEQEAIFIRNVMLIQENLSMSEFR